MNTQSKDAMWQNFVRIMGDYERARSTFWAQVDSARFAPWADGRRDDEARVIRAAEAHKNPSVRMMSSSLKIAQARMQEARNAMVEQLTPFIRGSAGRIAARHRDPDLRDDLIQEGALGILDAMRRVSSTLEGGTYAALDYLKKWSFTRMVRYAERERGYASRAISLSGPEEGEEGPSMADAREEGEEGPSMADAREEGASACDRQVLIERLGAFRAACDASPLLGHVFELLCKGYSEPEIAAFTPELTLAEVRKISGDVRSLALLRLK